MILLSRIHPRAFCAGNFIHSNSYLFPSFPSLFLCFMYSLIQWLRKICISQREKFSCYASLQVAMNDQRPNLVLMLSVSCSWSDFSKAYQTFFFYWKCFISNNNNIIILNVAVSIQVQFLEGNPVYFVSYTLFRERYSLTGNDQ